MARVEGEALPSGVASGHRVSLLILGLVPLVLLAGLVWLFLAKGADLVGRSRVPPDALLKLQIERVTFAPHQILATVRNVGPVEATVAQVMVNEALWQFSVSPGPTIPRLATATLAIPYPWVSGDPVEVKVVTSNGLTFKRTIAVATETPRPGAAAFGLFALLGTYVGVIPVFLGLLWFPFLRRVQERWFEFFLSLTAGLLVFLGVDALAEAFGVASRLGGPFKGVAVIVLGMAGSFLALVAIGRQVRGRDREGARARLALAYLVAVGIGLHNLGEGLAIGAAYALGEVALGAFLVLGFAIHNTTEGLAIVAPVTRDTARLGHLALLGLVAGGPTIVGTWIGGFTYSEPWALFFLSVGAGAIFQVVYEIARFRAADGGVLAGLARPRNLLGLLAGFLIMYATSFLVAK
jgi:zinc transporter ZupT